MVNLLNPNYSKHHFDLMTMKTISASLFTIELGCNKNSRPGVTVVKWSALVDITV